MIKVTLERSKIVIKGHAHYAKNGEDIVCAGVSSLFYALAEVLTEKGLITEFSAESGSAIIGFREMSEAVEMFLCGIKLLAENYPENVSFNLEK